MDRELRLRYHGRVLDQLGRQACQSPVSSLSEMVANAWDADAHTVDITVADGGKEGKIVVVDDGSGMTFDECQDRYLNAGYDKRGGNAAAKTPGGRNAMGRKGIGKFAGFGMGNKIKVETTSSRTGETTVFELDIKSLGARKYVEEGGRIAATTRGPDSGRRGMHGTTITLSDLTLARKISMTRLPTSLARRFLVHQAPGNFMIRVDGAPIPQSMDISSAECIFPRDYGQGRPAGLAVDGEWGVETPPNGKTVRWQIGFHSEPIDDEDLRGVAVFANGKMVQGPFFFNLQGARHGECGRPYMFGQVAADYIDQLDLDPTSIERQRINWEVAETAPLLSWGQQRIRDLLDRWGGIRAGNKMKKLEDRTSGFAERLDKIPQHERRTVKNVLARLAGLSTVGQKGCNEMAESILASWEGGRLRELWSDIAERGQFSESDLLDILIETDVVSALNVAEAVKARLYAVSELESRTGKKGMENAIRNHLASNPWIISPRWDAFAVEKSVSNIAAKCADSAGLAGDAHKGRVDLVLSSGPSLLVLEFMRPGLSLDRGHLDRCEWYVRELRERVRAATGSGFETVSAYIIADKISPDGVIASKTAALKGEGIVVMDWATLLESARAGWRDYLHILARRGNGDERLGSLVDDVR